MKTCNIKYIVSILQAILSAVVFLFPFLLFLFVGYPALSLGLIFPFCLLYILINIVLFFSNSTHRVRIVKLIISFILLSLILFLCAGIMGFIDTINSGQGSGSAIIVVPLQNRIFIFSISLTVAVFAGLIFSASLLLMLIQNKLLKNQNNEKREKQN